MANRSYLYSINEIPGNANVQRLQLKGLSEFRYDVPLAYILLVSGNTTVCDSLVVDAPEKVSLAGNYHEGLKNLYTFLNLVEKAPINNKSLFQQQVTMTREYLSRDDIKQDYVFLEMGELYSMTSYNDTDSVFSRIEEMLDLLKQDSIPDIKLSLYDEHALYEGWPNGLGINNWGEILYYGFTSPFTYHTPFKVAEVTGRDLAKKQQDLSDMAEALQNT